MRETANVSRSAKHAGVSRAEVYRERKNSETFSDAWDDAVEEGLDYLEEEARRRAFEGTERPVFHKGEECGYVREFSDTLMIFLLKGRRPEVYGDRIRQEHSGPAGGPIEQKQEVSGDLRLDPDIREALRTQSRRQGAGLSPADPPGSSGNAG